MSSTKDYCLDSKNNNKTPNPWCQQLSDMYKAYERNNKLVRDVRFNKKILFTYHMVNTSNSGACRQRWGEIDFKCFGNLDHMNTITDLEQFYDKM